jgi:hypothetical protein
MPTQGATQPTYRWPDGTTRAYPPPPDAQPRPTPEQIRASRGLPPKPSTTDDAALEQRARQILQQSGVDPTPENLRTFIERNRARLQQELRGGRGGR